MKTITFTFNKHLHFHFQDGAFWKRLTYSLSLSTQNDNEHTHFHFQQIFTLSTKNHNEHNHFHFQDGAFCLMHNNYGKDSSLTVGNVTVTQWREKLKGVL